jgi:hypothetical protein
LQAGFEAAATTTHGPARVSLTTFKPVLCAMKAGLMRHEEGNFWIINRIGGKDDRIRHTGNQTFGELCPVNLHRSSAPSRRTIRYLRIFC